MSSLQLELTNPVSFCQQSHGIVIGGHSCVLLCPQTETNKHRNRKSSSKMLCENYKVDYYKINMGIMKHLGKKIQRREKEKF